MQADIRGEDTRIEKLIGIVADESARQLKELLLEYMEGRIEQKILMEKINKCIAFNVGVACNTIDANAGRPVQTGG